MFVMMGCVGVGDVVAIKLFEPLDLHNQLVVRREMTVTITPCEHVLMNEQYNFLYYVTWCTKSQVLFLTRKTT